ncbi:MAG: M23 family metallopeptidase [Lachnospiraceae bacterium]|jgi:murein DD-endopeptidase MepM/ murein hydrolase activator NlpD|nr:M23 family metallopeptidase [Lachnospiraceae bacterium]
MKKRIRVAELRIALLTIAVNIFFLPSLPINDDNPLPPQSAYRFYLNGDRVGEVADMEGFDELLLEARRALAAASSELVFVREELAFEEIEIPGDVAYSSPAQLTERMAAVLAAHARETMQRSYSVKINDFIVNLASKEEVIALLQAAIDKYDEERRFAVRLSLDDARELSVLTAYVERRGAARGEEKTAWLEAGLDQAVTDVFANVEPAVEKDFPDYDRGLVSIGFGDTVEVVEAYLAPEMLHDLAWAIEEITKEEEKNQLYEVVAGDTLSGISLAVNIPLDKLIEMNDTLENENSIIRIGEQLVITVPEADFVIERKEERFIEEYYNEEIVYIPNDDWYTTQSKTLQEPSAGIRKIAAVISYRNNKEVEREILKEEVVYEAVAKIAERGTKIPPTYRKPLSGGRLSSGFGSRVAPTRGASTFHRGIDWATPVGTAIVASSGGVVSRAGWGSGYGYVVYIDHPDGRQTRYGHLSKVLVRVGQSVAQGEKIALSGNTGISTGPHLHFEILINGVQVNPARYMN